MTYAAVQVATAEMVRPTRVGRQHAGYAYLAVLLVIFALGVALSATSSLWHHASQREREAELLFVGEQYRKAIQQYYESSPGDKKYPTSLNLLLLDPRYPGMRRYLRRLYRDPLTGKGGWGMVMAPEGGVMGVYSQSEGSPIKQRGFAPALSGFEDAGRYADWQFVYRPIGLTANPANS